MQLRATAVMGAALVFWATAASAQDKPDFSAKWQLDAQKTAEANPQGGGGRGGRGGGMGPMTLTLDATSLTVERETGQGPVKTVYKLDGSEQTIQMGQGEAKATARWEGSTIVIETTRTFNDNTVTTKAVYSIEGEYLVVATTQPPRGGGEPVTRKAYYTKAM